MKNSLKIFAMSLVIMSLACGGGSNPIEAKKASLEKLKKQALELNAKIFNLTNLVFNFFMAWLNNSIVNGDGSVI